MSIIVEGEIQKRPNPTTAMVGQENARCNLGAVETKLGNLDCIALDNYCISWHCLAMHELIRLLKTGVGSRNAINSTLTAYNNSCMDMRSKARDKYVSKWQTCHGGRK